MRLFYSSHTLYQWRVHKSAERMVVVLQNLSDSGDSNNPSLQTVMKARLRVAS